jgi:plasmid replication initiation protein
VAKLLPDRHPQTEFFIADIFDGLPVKDDMASMEHPIFSLSKKKDIRVIRYDRAGIKITISPNAEYGLPTIFDKDILLYCGSLLMSELKKLEANGGGLPPKTLRISCNDLLKTTNRLTNGEAYELLENGLKRLTGVLVTTNIKTNEIEQREGFHLIESYRFIESHFVEKRRVALEITLSDWFYNSIIGKEALTINRDYFRLGRSLERRIYELARKHCGHQQDWKVAIKTLHEKSGSTGTIPKFRLYMKEIAADNHLPDYTLEIIEGDNILFKNRKSEYLPLFDTIQDLPLISAETIKKGAILVEQAGTGWDYQELRNQFNQELLNGFRPKRINGAFLNFLKKKIKNSP